MSTISDVMTAMKDVLLLTDKVDRSGKMLSELARELRDHDRRLIRLETMIEMAGNRQTGSKKKRVRSA